MENQRRRRSYPADLDDDLEDARARARYLCKPTRKELVLEIKELDKIFAYLATCEAACISKKQTEFTPDRRMLVFYALCSEKLDKSWLHSRASLPPEERLATRAEEILEVSEWNLKRFKDDCKKYHSRTKTKILKNGLARREAVSLIRLRKLEPELLDTLRAYATPLIEWQGIEESPLVEQCLAIFKKLEKIHNMLFGLFTKRLRINAVFLRKYAKLMA